MCALFITFVLQNLICATRKIRHAKHSSCMATTILVCTECICIGMHSSSENLFIGLKQKNKCREVLPLSILFRCATAPHCRRIFLYRDFCSGSTGSALLEKNFQKPDWVIHHCDITIMSCSLHKYVYQLSRNFAVTMVV